MSEKDEKENARKIAELLGATKEVTQHDYPSHMFEQRREEFLERAARYRNDPSEQKTLPVKQSSGCSFGAFLGVLVIVLIVLVVIYLALVANSYVTYMAGLYLQFIFNS